MTPNIIHTMKHTVKARVLTIRTDQACRGMGVEELTMNRTRLVDDETVLRRGFAEHPSSGYRRRAKRTMAALVRIVLKNYSGGIRVATCPGSISSWAEIGHTHDHRRHIGPQ
jgi:hypothetical protein